MKQLIYDPKLHGNRMTIVCFVSGSGTNYQRIVERDPNHDYIVFTNRPGCEGILRARQNGHIAIELSHAPYLRGAREKYGGNVPRNCPEREKYEQDVWHLIENRIQKMPDLVCLAGYDQWTTDWTVERYPSRILNVHPGDTTRGYDGLHWIPTAKAILAGDEEIRATLFLVDKGEDTGPALVQSKPLKMRPTLEELTSKELLEELHNVIAFARNRSLNTYERFAEAADNEHKHIMKRVCEHLQGALKTAGDWEIYPFGVHDLIARGRVAMDARTIYIDGRQMPVHGYRMDAPTPL